MVQDGRLFILTRQGEEEIVLALSPATGEEIWRYAYPVPYDEVDYASQWGPGPKGTITAAGDTIYSFGVTERLHALDAKTGKVRWEKDYSHVYEQPFVECGTSASPLVDGNLVIVPIGTTWPEPEKIQSEGALVAYDRATGKEVWRTDGLPPSYASPVVATLGGVRQIVTLTQNNAVGVRASDGKLLWKREMRTFMEQNIPTPLPYRDKVLVSAMRWGVAMLEAAPDAGAADGAFQLGEAWMSKRHEMYMDSPVLVGDHVYFRSNKKLGMLTCLDARTGETCWQGKPRGAGFVTIVAVGEHLLFLTEAGDLKVVAADPSAYQEEASWKVADTAVFTHLAVAGSRLFVKDEEHLAAFDVPGARVTEAPARPGVDAPPAVARAAKPVAGEGRCTAEEALALIRTATTLPSAKTVADVENGLKLYSDDIYTYAGEDKAMMREHRLRLLAGDDGPETTHLQVSEEEYDLFQAIWKKLNLYSQYLEWEGDLAVVRGHFYEFRIVGRQGISETLYYLAKRDGKCLIVGYDFHPLWERWGPEGQAKALSGYATE